MYIIAVHYVNSKAADSAVKENKAAHQCQDCVGGLGFRRESWAEAGLVEMLDYLVMCEEELYRYTFE